MNVLIVHYLPGGDRSNTKKLLDAAMALLKTRQAHVQVLDLVQDVPDFFSPERLGVYYARNYGGQEVSDENKACMARMDRMTDQLKSADILVVAFPMYNFSQPAAVKAWFDSVMQKGLTWDMGPTGYVGLLKGKKALALVTSGGQYDAGNPYEHCVSLTKVHLGFMGFETEVVTAGGINQFPDKASAVLEQAQGKVKDLLRQWVA
ncbi:MAG: NAD(P)H-dependent oxidoreductase [Candidatus Omnitrophota bacterium]